MVERHWGRRAYAPVWAAMQAFTAQRGAADADELWVLEHEPVFTLGLAGRQTHVLDPGSIPVLRSDRGGQVTYHGPGQAVVYVLVDLRRRGLGVRACVEHLESATITLLAGWGITAHRRAGAPGVYVDGAKIAALGLRVSRGCSYHGIALNVDLDLEPFTRIEPCGMRGLSVTRLADLGVELDVETVARSWVDAWIGELARCSGAFHP